MTTTSSDFIAITTYRYLRIGIVGLVLLLAMSVGIERTRSHCWQTSISAYYYTPVRAIFVAGLLAIGLCLIVIKGRGLEDAALNFAGMLAPVVAVVPTSASNGCQSSTPKLAGLELQNWVHANVHNNVMSLLLAGFAGLITAAIIASVNQRSLKAVMAVGTKEMRIGLWATLAFLMLGWLLFAKWSGFETHAHSYAALLMFIMLAAAIGSNAWRRRGQDKQRYVGIYGATAIGMVVVGIACFAYPGTWNHRILWLEMLEILLFATFWLTQTYEHWNSGR